MDNNRLNQLLELLSESKEDSFLLFAVAKEYEKRQEFDQALAHYLKITAFSPKYVGVYYHLGKLYEHLGDTEQAIKTYEAGIKMASAANDAHSRNELSTALMQIRE